MTEAAAPIAPTAAVEPGAFDVTVLMPCLDEAETLATCIRKARACLAREGIRGEVLVADNGSTDGSQAIALREGARVVPVAEKGYGAALQGGIAAARGRWVVMADADDSYDFDGIAPFVAKLREGHDLVMGNRFRGGIAPGAMPPLHRYLGNPVLTAIGRVLFRSPVGDFHCGLRGFDRDAIRALDLHTTGMEFASEMVVKATLNRLRIAEVPTTLSPDGRSRAPHLRSWRDGWRHLRFLLLYSPRWLFLYPGIAMTVLGLLGMGWLSSGPRTLGGTTFDIHTMLYAAVASIIGVQTIGFALFSKIYAIRAGLLPHDERLVQALERIDLERGLVAGGAIVLLGLAGAIASLLRWEQAGFGAMDPAALMRLAIPSAAALAIGASVVFMSFFLGLLLLKRR
ncbi:MAG TPA: glycosyltransferase [Xanthomonadales bacterium]|nr:glycosyltransferase [Xanthomonadales bacterium]